MGVTRRANAVRVYSVSRCGLLDSVIARVSFVFSESYVSSVRLRIAWIVTSFALPFIRP